MNKDKEEPVVFYSVILFFLLIICYIIIALSVKSRTIDDGNFYEIIEIDGEQYIWDKSIDGGYIKYEPKKSTTGENKVNQ